MTLDGDPIDVDTKKAIALLAYLAVEGASPRSSLAALLWADSSSERARATLRRTLSSLRAGVGADLIESDRERVALVGEFECDLQVFRHAVSASAAHRHDFCQSCRPHLVRAVDVYRGDFLESFSVRDAPDFEDWVRTIAESLRLEAGEALRRLAMAYASEGDYRAAIDATNRWIGLDDLHEPAHRLSMLLHTWAGDRPGAVEAYRAFLAILDRELGVLPLEETTELYEAILDEDVPPAPGVPRGGAPRRRPAVPSGRALLGRDEEMTLLRGELEETRRSGRVSSISGTAWMGKTRLIEELAAQAATAGHTVVTGRSFRMERDLPYGVVAQLLRSARERVDEIRGSIPGWALVELARIDPLLAPVDSPPHRDRFGEVRLFEAFKEVMAAVAGDGPALVAVDDVQWMDGASASMIAYLSQRISGVPLLLLMTRRTGENLPDILVDSLEGVPEIELRPLTAADLGDAADAGDLIERTGGVPLLVLEALSSEPGTVEGDGVVEYMEARLREVSDLGRQVLSSAAVLTGVCDAALLRSASGRSEEEIVEAVEELIDAGLMRELPDTDGLGFTLDALETLIYDSLTLVRRRLLHRRAAEALSMRPKARTDARLAAAVATQYRGAGDRRASEWFRLAGDLARSAYANEEARVFYDTAVALGPVEPVAPHLGLGELAMVSGDYRTALQQLTAASAHATGAQSSVVEHRLGEVHRLLGRFDLASEHYQRSVEGHPRPAELYADWALLAHRTGRAAEAADLARQAVEASSGAADAATLSRAHNVSGVVATDPTDAMEHLEVALDHAGTNDLAQMAALNNMAHLLGRWERTEAAIDLVRRAIEIAQQTGHLHREAALWNHLADLHHRAGEKSLSEEAQTHAMKLFAGVSGERWEPEVWLLTQW